MARKLGIFRQSLIGQKDKYTDWMARKLSMFAKKLWAIRNSSTKKMNINFYCTDWMARKLKYIRQKLISQKDQYTDWMIRKQKDMF